MHPDGHDPDKMYQPVPTVFTNANGPATYAKCDTKVAIINY